MAISTFTKTGSKATTAAKLDAAVFALEVKNHDLLKQAYVAYQANGRTNNAKTLTRGEVSGGGKKPWKQKGTGRARFGSIRVPIWRGGGITFGPVGDENYSKKLPVSAKRTAIRQALSVKAAANKIVVIESFENKAGKTSDSVALLNKIGATRNVLLVVEDKSPEIARSTNNIDSLKVSQALYLNVFDVMNADTIVFTQEALGLVHQWLGAKKESK